MSLETLAAPREGVARARRDWLLLAAATSVVLRHSVLAVCAIWLSAAAVCLIAAWTTRPGRP